MHNDIHLTMATWDCDHVRDIASGAGGRRGSEITHLQMEVEEIFRFAKSFEWDVSELSFAKYCSIMSQDNHRSPVSPFSSAACLGTRRSISGAMGSSNSHLILRGNGSVFQNGRRRQLCMLAAGYIIRVARSWTRLNGCRQALTRRAGSKWQT